jgi:AcrR family transcriptional regulator
VAEKKIKTRERIVLVSLELFNDKGEPNITTIDISNELEISPGNLYYHYQGKEAIVNELFARFEAEMQALLDSPLRKTLGLAEYWVYLQVIYECIHRYRFLYRDLADLLTRYHRLKNRFNLLLSRMVRVCTETCEEMVTAGVMDAHPNEIEALAENMVMTMTYWYGFQVIRSRQSHPEADIDRAIYLTVALVAPYLHETQRNFLQDAADLYKNGLLDQP